MLSFFASVIATPFGLDGHAATMAAVRRVVRKDSVTRSKARGSIRDAIRRGSDWHGRHTIPRGDGANWPFGSRDTRAADREHQDPAPCAGARHCNWGSTISEGIADAIRIAGSTNQSRHSPRIVPMTRSQIALAIGLRGG